MEHPALSMKNITKVYPNGVVANRDVTFEVNTGEIHALSGENGAGKTTLMKILFGEEKPTSGSILIGGREVDIRNPQDALGLGIGMVHQHFMLVPSLTVTENVILGIEKRKGLGIDYRSAEKLVGDMGRKYNMYLDPMTKVRDLSVGQKQKLEILKILIRGAKILILDEPTAVLTPQETGELFSELKNLRDQGFTIIFISHKLDEIRELCDRITIIRHGETKGVFGLEGITDEELSQRMIGRDVQLTVEKPECRRGGAVLSVKDVVVSGDGDKPLLDRISFTLHSGEILGIAGVEGNGQSQLVDAITGIGPYDGGEILFSDSTIRQGDIRRIRKSGMGYIPEDRMTLGISPSLSVTENMIADKIDDPRFFSKGGFIDNGGIDAFSRQMIEDYAILCQNGDVSISSLSGGNIQKVVLAREMSSNPKLIIANQPTRGVDVGATEFIRRKLVAMRDSGCAVLLVSSDLNELLGLSDRLLVMYGGRFAACFSSLAGVDGQTLGRYMLGLDKQDEDEISRSAM